MEDNAVIVSTIKDIIDMNYECGTVLEGDTFLNMFRHYLMALAKGNVEIVYKYGELMAFADWVRVAEIPEKDGKLKLQEDGPILFVMNCCIKDDSKHKYLWRITHMIKSKNKGYDTICWREKDGNYKIFSNRDTIKEEVKEEEKQGVVV